MLRVLRRTTLVLLAIVLVSATTAVVGRSAGAAPDPGADVVAPEPSLAGAARASFAPDWAATTPMGAYNVRIVGETFSSPAVGDVTGDDRPEIVVGSNSGKILVYSVTGVLVRSFFADAAPTTVLSSPALANLTGDAKLEIVVGMMPVSDATAGATVAAFRGDGARIWARKTCRFAGKPCNVFASPAIGDVDGDGRADVVIGTQDHFVYALRGNTGADLPGWPFFLWDTTWSSAGIADLDGNGTPEVVIASDLDIPTCQQNPAVQPCTFGSILRILRGNGTEWLRYNIPGEITISSPAIGDVNGDSSPDIVIGSGFYFLAYGYSDIPSRRIWAFDRFLRPIAGWPVQLGGRSMASPALVDVDGNGTSEVATMAEDGRVTMLNGNGSRRWAVCNRNPGQLCNRVDFSMNSSPVVGDVDADGVQEVVAVSEHTLRVFDARDGTVEWSALLWQNDRRTFANAATPALASVNGQARIFVHGLVDTNADNARGNGDADSLWSFSATNDLGPSAWPMFRHDVRRSGTALTMVPVQQTPNGRYVAHAYRALLGRDATVPEIRAGVNLIAAFGRATFARNVVFSRESLRRVVEDRFLGVLGRSSGDDGTGLWTEQLLRGLPARDFTITLYASDEYYANAGRTVAGFASAIFEDFRGRPPTAAQRATWVAAVQQRGRAAVARDFYQSISSRERRVVALYETLLGRTPNQAGLNQWAPRLVTQDDLAVATTLVAGASFFAAAQPG